MQGRLTVLTTIALLGQTAWAAPWVRPDSEVYARSSLASETVSGLAGWRSDFYAEMGVSKKWTVTGKLEGIAYERRGQDFNDQGWRVSARRQLFKRGTLVGSVEIGALQGGAIGGRLGCETLGAEVRTGLAWSGTVRETETFVFVEGIGRFHAECDRQRLELGIGQKALGPIWVLTQVWLERGDPIAQSVKTQTEFIWRGSSTDYSIGYRDEIGGLFEEDAFFVAIAKRF